MTAAAQLAGLLGADAVSSSQEDLLAHSCDWSPNALLARRRGRDDALPACVVRPSSSGEVAKVLRWAQETSTPVVPFGGGSAVVSAIRPDGAVVVDTARLDGISEVDDSSRLVTAGAGVTGPSLTGALDRRGYRLGHEPQSLAISTVGGWVATRACGQLSARYGGIEALIAGLEAVLPGGKVVRMKTAPRRSCGPDVASLMIGSEGALGVVTEVTLRVAAQPGGRADACVRFDHMTDGVRACRALAQSDLAPTLVRLYDRDDAALFLLSHPGEEPGPLLLLSFEGDGCDDRARRAVELCGGRPGDERLVAHWWSHRNDAVDEFRRIMDGAGLLGPHGVVDTMEVAATWSGLRALYHSMKDSLTGQADIAGCHVSHIYPDGACLYFTLAAACSSDEEAERKLSRWWDSGMTACLAAGGTISHHHGIGRLKAPWLDAELGGWFEVLRAVKQAVDPKAIMNPGALGL